MMHLLLPGALADWAKEQAVHSGFASAEDYLIDLLKREYRREAEGDSALEEDYGAPAHLCVTSKADLEAKLIEGLESGPATPMTAEDWAELGNRVERRIAQQNAQ